MKDKCSLTTIRKKLYLNRGSGRKSMMIARFFYRAYRNIPLDADYKETLHYKNGAYLSDGIENCRKSNLIWLSHDKIPNTKARKIERLTIENRLFIKVYLKKSERTLYFNDSPGLYDILQDTKLCFLVSNSSKVQAHINSGDKSSGQYEPHLGQVAMAAYQGKLDDSKLDQAREIIDRLTDHQNKDVDHLLEDRCNFTIFNLSLMDGTANKKKNDFFSKFYDPWRVYGAYNDVTGEYLIELALIDSIADEVIHSWYFKCKSADALLSWIENIQGKPIYTILSSLDSVFIDYNGERWAFPTPWTRYKQVKAACKGKRKLPMPKRDTVDDIKHQLHLIDMDKDNFANWTVLPENLTVEDLGNFLFAMFGRRVYCFVEPVNNSA